MSLRDSIELTVARVHMEGREKFGDLGLQLPRFHSRIASIVSKHLGLSPSPQAALAFVKELHGRDLYLATACAQSSPGSAIDDPGRNRGYSSIAWKCLEATYKGLINDLVRFMYPSGYASQDLADSVLADLFFPDRSGSSRIASYDGRSSLSTWLRVVVCNRMINAQRFCATSRTADLVPELPDRAAQLKMEATLQARRYGPVLEDSLASACGALTPRERLMLLWRYEDGLQLGQIARLLGIHQSNVTRQLERLQSKLRDEVEAILAAKHGLSRRAIRECLQDIVANPNHPISILEFVKTGQDPSRRMSYAAPSSMISQPTRGLKPAFRDITAQKPA